MSTVVCLGGVVTACADAIHHGFTNKTLNSRLEFLENGEEYTTYINSNTQKLYEELRLGEITSSQFSQKYDRLTSDETFIEWARTLENPQVKEIIADYDKKGAALDKRFAVYYGLMFGGFAGMGVSAAGLILLDGTTKPIQKEIAKKEQEEQAER